MKIAMVVAIALAGLSGARAQDMKAERDRIVAAADARRDAREALSKDRASGNRAALSEDRQKLAAARATFREVRIQAGIDRAAVRAELTPLREKVVSDRQQSTEDRGKLAADRASGNPATLRADREKLRDDRARRVADREALREARASHGLPVPTGPRAAGVHAR